MLMLMFLTSVVYGQATTAFATDSIQQDEMAWEYELYPTKNMWTFLKLDTRNGKIWQVQYSTEGSSYRYETVLNDTDLSLSKYAVRGRFKLYPTTNIYNFIMLDRLTGIPYQVQWNSDPAQRVVIMIKSYN